jgi:hypothetical protein
MTGDPRRNDTGDVTFPAGDTPPEISMKTAALIVLGVLAASIPALANDSNNANDLHRQMHHASYRMSHRHAYKWNYKSEAEERRATEDLNRQYRGQPVDR